MFIKMAVRWLHLSIFYKREKWSDLLCNELESLLNELRGSVLEIDFNFKIHLSNRRGDHIRLSIEVENNNCVSFLDQFSLRLNKYLDRQAEDEVYNQEKVEKFLKDFPTNSIFYKLHQSSILNLNTSIYDHLHKLQTAYSYALIKAFDCSVFGYEELSIFYMYSALVYLFQLKEGLEDFRKEIEGYQRGLTRGWSN